MSSKGRVKEILEEVKRGGSHRSIGERLNVSGQRVYQVAKKYRLDVQRAADNRRRSAWVVDEVRRMAEAGCTMAAAAAYLSLHVDTVGRIARSNGCKFRRANAANLNPAHPATLTPLAQERLDKAKALLALGMTQKQAAAQLGMHRVNLCQLLRKHAPELSAISRANAIQARSGMRPKTVELAKEARELRDEGLTAKEVATRLGISAAYVYLLTRPPRI